MAEGEARIGVTAFKGRCLALIDAVAKGKARRVVLTRHGRDVAALVPIAGEARALWGALRGSVRAAPGVDLAAPTGETWDADG